MATRKPRISKQRRTQKANTAPTSTFQQAAENAGLDCCAGLSAIAHRDRSRIKSTNDHRRITGSVDLDGHYQASEPNASRWDYGVGVRLETNTGETRNEHVYWIEPHPASSTAEVERMLNKLDWLQAKLQLPEFLSLRQIRFDGEQHSKSPSFLWLCSGKNRIRPQSQEARRLRRRGLSLPQRVITL